MKKFNLKCFECNHEKEVTQEICNKLNIDYYSLDLDRLTSVQNKLLCSQCKKKNLVIIELNDEADLERYCIYCGKSFKSDVAENDTSIICEQCQFEDIQKYEQKSNKKCDLCGEFIEQERLEILPETNVCIKCVKSFHKTEEPGPEIVYCKKCSKQMKLRDYIDRDTGFKEQFLGCSGYPFCRYTEEID